jgi:hypothetical protein
LEGLFQLEAESSPMMDAIDPRWEPPPVLEPHPGGRLEGLGGYKGRGDRERVNGVKGRGDEGVVTFEGGRGDKGRGMGKGLWERGNRGSLDGKRGDRISGE